MHQAALVARLTFPAFLLLVVSAVFAGGGRPLAGDARPATIPDLYRVKAVSQIDLSPDGETLVYSVRNLDLPRGRSNTDLYLLPLADGEPRRITWTEEAHESEPTWSPDGRWIAFVARRGEQEQAQLWLLPARGGEARAVTALSTGVAGPRWSPDGRSVAFRSEVYPDCGADDGCNRERMERREKGPLDAHVTDELLYRHWTQWNDGRVSHVLVVEIASGLVRDLTPGEAEAPAFAPGGSTDYVFSPDGAELCYTRSPEPAASRAWSTNVDLWAVPVDPDEQGNTRPARNLTRDNPAWDGTPRYSPDGRFLAFRRQERAGFEADRFRLALLERSKGRIRDLTPEFEDWVLGHRWSPDSRALVFRAPSEGATPLFRVEASGGPVTRVAEYGYLDEFVLAPGGKRAHAVRRSMGEPREVWTLDLEGGDAPVRQTHHNAALEREVDFRPAETIWVEGTAGRQIQVLLVKPHGFDPSRRYPLILNVHGGPQYMWADAFRGDAQLYPGAGYVVAFPNPHGSTGYGQPFTDAISRDWGGKVFDDLMKVADTLEKLPWIDGDRVGAMGWSYGGYMMNWFQARTGRFRALANMMGIFDLRSFYLATEELWFPEWDLGLPWSSRDYATWNPAESIDRFETPMLIVTGELDFRVPYTQSLMAFTALRRRGVPSRLVVLPEAGHWPGWYEMALYYTAHLDWFHRYLGGDAPPWSVEAFAANAVFDPETGARIDATGE